MTILLACLGGGLLRGLSDKPLPFGGFGALIGPSVGLSAYEARVGLPGVGEALSPRCDDLTNTLSFSLIFQISLLARYFLYPSWVTRVDG